MLCSKEALLSSETPDEPEQRGGVTRFSSRVRSQPAVQAVTPSGFISPKLEGRLEAFRAHPRKTNGADKAPKGGRGVFARVPLKARETLAVWGGRIVTEAELQLLPRNRHRLCLQVDEGLFIVTTREGPADWINHSCEPNAGLSGQIVLVAMRDIEPGEEICFDYAMTDSFPYDEFDCQCGSSVCRRRVTADDWRDPALQSRYRGFFSPYLEKLIARGDGRNGS
jgi:hypothetical protein